MARAPEVRVQARPTGDRLQGATDNAALQLADALREIEPAAEEFAQQRATDLRREASLQARQDALRTSGAAFKDAVAQGLIEKTQNPFYMDAYERESANVQASRQLATLTAESQTWEERNDPALFQDRLNRELGTLGEAYTGEEAQIGFLAAVAPVQQQLSAANTARNVQRINTERDANSTAIVASTVMEANRANGGNASPEQIFTALQDSRDEYINTGGSASEWNNIVIAGVETAAYNAQDTDLINVLKDPLSNPGGVGSLYDTKAADLEQSQYRIRQGYLDRLGFQEAERRAIQTQEGGRVREAALVQYGAELLTGDFDPNEFIAWGQAQGFSLGGIAEAIRQVQSTVADTVSLQRARQTAFSLDPQNAKMLLDLAVEGERNGYSPGYADKVGDLVLQGVVPMEDARSLIGNAFQRTRQQESENRADARESRAQERQDRADDPSYIENYGDLQNQFLNKAAAGLSILETRTRRPASAADEQAINRAVERAGRAYLAAHPGDFAGAIAAAETETARWVSTRTAPRATTPRPSGSNPRR